MAILTDDDTIDAIVFQVMELQDRENTTLPNLEQQLKEVESGIENILDFIQGGHLTAATSGRLEKLEAQKEDLEIRIANEKITAPRFTEDFLRFYLLRFRKLDMKLQDHRRILIDTFINAIYLYDDKIVLTFNYNDGTKTITFDDVIAALSNKNNGSDLESSVVPKPKKQFYLPIGLLFYVFHKAPEIEAFEVSGLASGHIY